MALLTVSEFRERYTTGLSDAVLTDLLSAAEDAINARYGAIGAAVTEIADGGLTWITLRRRATSVTAITETYLDSAPVTLAGDDYRIRNDRRSLQRIDFGANPSRLWTGLVSVQYTPDDDTDERKRVQAELVKLDINSNPGSGSRSLGDFSESHGSSRDWNYEVERETILASLLAVDVLDFA